MNYEFRFHQPQLQVTITKQLSALSMDKALAQFRSIYGERPRILEIKELKDEPIPTPTVDTDLLGGVLHLRPTIRDKRYNRKTTNRHS